MDSIFEEDSGEVGGEIEAHCPSPRCKADTTHTIVSMYEDEIRRVKCVVCDDVHAYRKPRGDGAEDADLVPKKRTIAKPSWNDALTKSAESDLHGCRAYSIRDTYEEGDFVLHPVFEVGMVTESLPDNKVEVVFRDGLRVLVHNRVDLAVRMPGLSDQSTPREAKKKRSAGREELSETPLRTTQQAIETAKAGTQRKNEGGGKALRGKGTTPPSVAAAPVAKGKASATAVAKPGKAAAPAKAGKPVANAVAPANAGKPATKKVAKPAAKSAKATKLAKAVTKKAPAKKAAKPVIKKVAKPAAKKAVPTKKAVAKAKTKPSVKKPVPKAAKKVAKSAKAAKGKKR